jgi:hypothetical protein
MFDVEIPIKHGKTPGFLQPLFRWVSPAALVTISNFISWGL